LPGRGVSRFADALCAEIAFRSKDIAVSLGCGNTLYIGGGTPSVLPLSDIRRILDALESVRPASGELTGNLSALTAGSGAGQTVKSFDEFTIEVNPDDIVSKGAGYVEGLRALGVNRISMGVQSMDDEVLRWMNRRHDAETARKAYRIIRSAGIGDVSIDLIFGYSMSFALDRWRRTLDAALDLAGDGTLPGHISAYQLSVEGGSALADLVAAGKYAEAPEELCAEQYEMLCSSLGAAGYHHYEISNFALPGHEAKHNSAYWRHVPYVGLGPAAHSLVPAGPYSSLPVRRWNKEDVGAYIKAAETGCWSDVVSGEELDEVLIREEKILLSLRTDRGISRNYLEMDGSARSAVEKFLCAGSLVPVSSETLEYYGFPHNDDRLRIPENRFFVSDGIISELL